MSDAPDPDHPDDPDPALERERWLQEVVAAWRPPPPALDERTEAVLRRRLGRRPEPADRPPDGPSAGDEDQPAGGG